MLQNSTLASFSLTGLAHRCRQETERFFQGGTSDDSFCFELFRRAIVDRVQDAWELIFAQYTPLVSSWVHRHQAFPSAQEEADYFVNRAFERLWHALTPEKFGRMANLKALIAYLKLCVHAAVIEHVERRIKAQEWSESDMDTDINTRPAGRSVADTVRGEMMAGTVWACIERVIKDETEAVIARCSFVYEMKPSEIVAEYPDLFPDVKMVYRQKENLLARLGRDSQLQALFEDHA